MLLGQAAEACIGAFAAAGVPTIVLKGLDYEVRLYNAPAARPTADVDLLVPGEQRRAAFAVLDRHHLLQRCPPSVEIVLIERAVQFGRGAAYATGNPNHLLNVPAGRMSAFHDRPRDFLDWLQQQDAPDCPPFTENCFVPHASATMCAIC